MTAVGEHPRRDDILDAAFDTFLLHGFARTSMTDLAAAAGVSRQTAYRAFEGKAAVFRAVVERLHAAIAAELERAAATPGPLADRLARVVVAKLATTVDVARRSPHSHDLLELNDRVAGDLAEASDARVRRLVAAVLSDELDDPEQVRAAVALVMALLAGWEQQVRAGDPEPEWEREVTAAVAIVAAGLEARRLADAGGST